ncbi:NAD(P)-binding protein [Mycena leptocephala]|nr:NAD(P)-binding protein [Mycena leptocephala]
MSRIVSIFGATGNQVGGVLKLKARGVEVVKGDTADKASLVNALRGSEAVFAVTLSSWPPYSPEKPIGVKFFIFSSVPGLTKLTGGRFSKVAAYDDKEVIEEYLKSSGIANASLHLGAFTENLWTQRSLKKTDTGFTISVPKYSPTSLQAFSWVGHDVGQSALALLKSYSDPSKNVSGKAYPVVTAQMTFPDLAAMIAKVLGVEVTFTSVPTSGNPVFDEMFEAQSEYNGFYTATPVPNPDLVALGAKFGTMEEFLETEMKKRFAQ